MLVWVVISLTTSRELRSGKRLYLETAGEEPPLLQTYWHCSWSLASITITNWHSNSGRSLVSKSPATEWHFSASFIMVLGSPSLSSISQSEWVGPLPYIWKVPVSCHLLSLSPCGHLLFYLSWNHQPGDFKTKTDCTICCLPAELNWFLASVPNSLQRRVWKWGSRNKDGAYKGQQTAISTQLCTKVNTAAFSHFLHCFLLLNLISNTCLYVCLKSNFFGIYFYLVR